MRTLAAAGVGAGLCITMLLACSWSLEGFSGGSPGDAGGDAHRASSADVNNEDAVVTRDSASDAVSDAGSADADSFCAHVAPSALSFCQDFDRKASISILPSGLSIRMDEFTSAPNAMRMDISALDGGFLIASLKNDFAATPRRVRVSADLKVLQSNAFVNVISLLFDISGPARTGTLSLQVEADGYHVVEQIYGSGLNDFKVHPLVARTWPATSFSHVELTWHDNLTADFVIDGVAIRMALPLLTSWGKWNLRLQYGIVYANGSGDFRGAIDNVVVDGDL